MGKLKMGIIYGEFEWFAEEGNRLSIDRFGWWNCKFGIIILRSSYFNFIEFSREKWGLVWLEKANFIYSKKKSFRLEKTNKIYCWFSLF